MTNRSYSELIKIPIFIDRIKYLQTNSRVGENTFGGHRYLNQLLYSSSEWKQVRRQVVIRDDGHDLSHKDYPISGAICVHHINPISADDILNRRECVFDLENLISASFTTHNMIHYGEEFFLIEPIERKPNDTCLWK